MSGSLVLIDSATATSSDTVINLGGTNWIDTFDVYCLRFNEVGTGTDTKGLQFRFLDSSNSAISDSTYDVAFTVLKSVNVFEDGYGTNGTFGFLIDLRIGTGNSGDETANGEIYIFNANNASEHTTYSIESVYLASNNEMKAPYGFGTLTNTEVVKGVSIFLESNVNFTQGDFKLYGIKS